MGLQSFVPTKTFHPVGKKCQIISVELKRHRVTSPYCLVYVKMKIEKLLHLYLDLVQILKSYLSQRN